MLQCVSGLVDKEARLGRACSTLGAFYLLYVYHQSIKEDDDGMAAAQQATKQKLSFVDAAESTEPTA
jgi:hypothetical protein